MNRYTLITGISGFVGDHLGRFLTARGRTVAGTYLSTPISIPGVATVPVDATDRRAVSRLIRDMKPAEVVHCAAATNGAWCEKWPEEAHAAIYQATENLVLALEEHAPETPLVSFSTDLVFDGESAPYDEDAAPKPISRYGSLKYAAENLVGRLENATTLRSALVYGPHATVRSSFLDWMVQTLAKREPLTLFEDEWRTPVFVDDLCHAVDILLARLPQGGTPRIFHAGGPDRLSRVEIGIELCHQFQLEEEHIRRMQRDAVPSAPPRPRDVSLRCSRLNALGWKQTPFTEGLKECRTRWNDLRNGS